MSIDALIPARAGSKRIKQKNIQPIGGHPLLAYSISAAWAAGIFRRVIVSTDMPEAVAIAEKHGAEVHKRRPEDATDMATDYDWILPVISSMSRPPEFFAILRPTAPFRQPETIRRAWRAMQGQPLATCLKAVSRIREHPGKAWVCYDPTRTGPMEPLMNYPPDGGLQSYERPTQSLPAVWIQNASLDICRSRNVIICHNVCGSRIFPFYTQGYEGFDVNTPEDWLLAKLLVKIGAAKLPEIGEGKS